MEDLIRVKGSGNEVSDCRKRVTVVIVAAVHRAAPDEILSLLALKLEGVFLVQSNQ